MRQRPYRIVALALAMALALVGAILGSSVRPAVAAPSETGGTAKAEHQRVVDFWTPERMAQAQPRDYVRDPATGGFELASDRGMGSAADPGSRRTVMGAIWTGDGLVQRTTGKAFFVIGGNLSTCSASVVQDSSELTSLVLTAAHCVYDNEAKAFASFWLFIPDYAASPATGPLDADYCAQTPYGCWTAQGLTVPQGYADQDTFNDTAAVNDVAFVTIGPGFPDGGQLDATVGVQQVEFAAQEEGVSTYVFGYPASQGYTGAELVYSAGRLRFDQRKDDLTYRVASDMAGGNSGGPWYTGFDPDTGAGTTTSVTSYGYADQPFMYGPIFDATTQELHQAADGFTGGTQIVP